MKLNKDEAMSLLGPPVKVVKGTVSDLLDWLKREVDGDDHHVSVSAIPTEIETKPHDGGKYTYTNWEPGPVVVQFVVSKTWVARNKKGS